MTTGAAALCWQAMTTGAAALCWQAMTTGVMYQEYQEYLVCYAGRLLTWCDVSGDGPHYSAVLAGNDHWCEPSCLTATQCTSPCGNNESSLCGGMGAQAGV